MNVMATILFMGLLVVTAQGRPEAGKRSYLDGDTNTVDGVKISVRFCTIATHNDNDCYCCVNLKSKPCFRTRARCQAQCPSQVSVV
ncbi:hypothetical protein BRADI_2g18573v3 [Brachypodium distachyon]|uniref:Meg domain-containing protein n=1 Tax=Brachypodium distachyon TaxID=15368 RepID=A0A0Q3IH02_BRADI|nr:hypothetical protein BRADI_2g18573v3 [Brachypodium distachyon]